MSCTHLNNVSWSAQLPKLKVGCTCIHDRLQQTLLQAKTYSDQMLLAHFEVLSVLHSTVRQWSLLCCRDHRKLGQELELFSIEAETAGGGLVFWHPNGAAIRNILENFWKVSRHIRSQVLAVTNQTFSERLLTPQHGFLASAAGGSYSNA